MFVSPRTGNLADGCCMLVRLRDATLKTFSFNDLGHRVVQVVTGKFGDEEMALVQTHLTYPHPTKHDIPMRYHQGRKLGEFVKDLECPHVIVFGDMNSHKGVADPAVQNIITFGGLDGHGPVGLVSHLSHSGDKMECDLVMTSGCKIITIWLMETEEDLLMEKLLSDHRSCHAIISLENHTVSCDSSEAKLEP